MSADAWDNAPAIQAAIDALPPSGGIVWGRLRISMGGEPDASRSTEENATALMDAIDDALRRYS